MLEERSDGTLGGRVARHAQRRLPRRAYPASRLVEPLEAERTDAADHVRCRALERARLRHRRRVELEADREVVREHVQLLPGRIGGVPERRDAVEREPALEL